MNVILTDNIKCPFGIFMNIYRQKNFLLKVIMMCTILALSLLLKHKLYYIDFIMLYYTCWVLYLCKPKKRVYVGDAVLASNVTMRD